MLVLGHRGVINETLSQNSLLAFRQAIDAADGFETDACLSADGEVFLIHPDKDNSIAWLLEAQSAEKVGNNRFDQLTAANISRLRLKHGEAIPTLRQALELIGNRKGKIIDIELKSAGVAGFVITILRDCFQKKIIQPESVVISSFDQAMLLTARKELPQIKVDALFAYEDDAGQSIYPWLMDGKTHYATINEFYLSDARLQEIQPDWLVVPETLLTEATVRLADRYFPNAGLVGWTVSEAGNFDFSASLKRIKALPKGKVAAMIVDDPSGFVLGYRKSGL